MKHDRLKKNKKIGEEHVGKKNGFYECEIIRENNGEGQYKLISCACVCMCVSKWENIKNKKKYKTLKIICLKPLLQ